MNNRVSNAEVRETNELQQNLILDPLPLNEACEKHVSITDSDRPTISLSENKENISHSTMFNSEDVFPNTENQSQVLPTSEKQPKNEMKTKSPKIWTVQYPREYLFPSLHCYQSFTVRAGEGILKLLPDALRGWVAEHTPNVRLTDTPAPWRPSKTEPAFRLKIDRDLHLECIKIVMSHGKITQFQAREITLAIALKLLKSQLSKQVSAEVHRHVENICHAFD